MSWEGISSRIYIITYHYKNLSETIARKLLQFNCFTVGIEPSSPRHCNSLQGSAGSNACLFFHFDLSRNRHIRELLSNPLVALIPLLSIATVQERRFNFYTRNMLLYIFSRDYLPTHLKNLHSNFCHGVNYLSIFKNSKDTLTPPLS